MHLFRKTLLLALFFAFCFHSFAVDSSKVKVAVLVPLYLDSAFNGSAYKLGGSNIPKYILPGLDFYNGIMMAIDSLQKEGQPLEVMIHDTKSKDKPLSVLLVEPEIASASFIIGSFTTKDELKKVSDFSQQKNIPLISATYPNDGGVTASPNLALVNSTLITHIEGLYKFVQRNYSLDNVFLIKSKNDQMDDLIRFNFEETAKKYSALPLKIKYLELSDPFNPQEIISQLDSNRKSVIIGATLNETAASNIVRTLSSIKTSYESVAVGMPTWDNMKELNKAGTKGIEIIFSTPYNYQRTDKFLSRLAVSYKAKINGRASDMMFKGYETMYHFSKLYIKHKQNFLKNISDKDFKIASDYDFQPAKAKKENTSTDYLENKKLYFITKIDGVVRSVK
jgi:ABC-type branched-subunit amino acid transport system substrate-binding protein